MNARDADAALEELLDGNRRFVAGSMKHPRQTAFDRHGLAAGQAPFAAILGCADSRVPPEIIFDQGLGDLFVVRVAGNIADHAPVLASLEYAVAHLRTPLLLVLGHGGCGAVRATIETLERQVEAPGHLDCLVKAIRPAVLDARRQEGDPLERAIRLNVLRTAIALTQTPPVLAAMARDGLLRIAGAYYDLESGQVELLGPSCQT